MPPYSASKKPPFNILDPGAAIGAATGWAFQTAKKVAAAKSVSGEADAFVSQVASGGSAAVDAAGKDATYVAGKISEDLGHLLTPPPPPPPPPGSGASWLLLAAAAAAAYYLSQQ